MNSSIIFSGIFGTLAMTLFMEALALLTQKPFRVIRNLRILLFPKTEKAEQRKLAHFIATVIHYAIGVTFAFVFKILITNSIEFTFLNAILFGIAIAIIAVISWSVLISIRKNAIDVVLRDYLILIFLGHLIIACVFYLWWQTY